MSDPYQLGSDIEWLKHTNDEMTRLVKKRNGQLARWRAFCLLLMLALGWVVYKFQERLPIEELWNFKLGGSVAQAVEPAVAPVAKPAGLNPSPNE